MEEFYYFEYKSIGEEFRDFLFSVFNMDAKQWIALLGITICLLSITCIALVIEINYKDKCGIWVPKCYREEMNEDGGFIVSINKDTGEIQNVSGSLYRYLRTMPESANFDDEDLSKLFIKYCYYVDKNYGVEPKFVEENIAKDAKDILACKFL